MYLNHTVRAYHQGYSAIQQRHNRKIRIYREEDHSLIYECESVERVTEEELKELIDSVINRKG